MDRSVVISTPGATTQSQLQLPWFRHGTPQVSALTDTLPNLTEKRAPLLPSMCLPAPAMELRIADTKIENYRLTQEQFTGHRCERRKWTATTLTRVHKMRLTLYTTCSLSLTPCGVTTASSTPLHCSACHAYSTVKRHLSWKPGRIPSPPPHQRQRGFR